MIGLLNNIDNSVVKFGNEVNLVTEPKLFPFIFGRRIRLCFQFLNTVYIRNVMYVLLYFFIGPDFSMTFLLYFSPFTVDA